MPDPKFAKPWHGIPREQVDWHPTVNEAACIGCGTCITGCGRLVYHFNGAPAPPTRCARHGDPKVAARGPKPTSAWVAGEARATKGAPCKPIHITTAFMRRQRVEGSVLVGSEGFEQSSGALDIASASMADGAAGQCARFPGTGVPNCAACILYRGIIPEKPVAASCKPSAPL